MKDVASPPGDPRGDTRGGETTGGGPPAATGEDPPEKTGDGWGDGDSGLSGISGTFTFRGPTIATGAGGTTWTSSSDTSS